MQPPLEGSLVACRCGAEGGETADGRCRRGVPALAGMDDATLTEWVRPVLARYLTGPAP